ncbi:putative adenylyl-sulfate kinase [Candidatus Anstonella stagnisolia]|nr:putative adenylyl-sulfate kinase [Candidatus Anstonella stagnisolia]
MEEGKLVWITGLAGSGKSTLAKKVYEKLKGMEKNTVHLDGDILREALGSEAGYSPEERKKLALTYARLCSLLTRQGINVVIATISLFHEVHEYNAKNNRRYYEIVLEVGAQELARRNQKGLYTSGKDVMGVHHEAQFPKKPTLRLQNDTQTQLEDNFAKIMEVIA